MSRSSASIKSFVIVIGGFVLINAASAGFFYLIFKLGFWLIPDLKRFPVLVYFLGLIALGGSLYFSFLVVQSFGRRNVSQANLGGSEIKKQLLALGIDERFDGDAEFIALANKKIKSDVDLHRMVELLDNSKTFVTFQTREKLRMPPKVVPSDPKERSEAAYRALVRHLEKNKSQISRLDS
jgi:hypothetical protein